jgi:dipeptidyl-peptidase 4
MLAPASSSDKWRSQLQCSNLPFSSQCLVVSSIIYGLLFAATAASIIAWAFLIVPINLDDSLSDSASFGPSNSEGHPHDKFTFSDIFSVGEKHLYTDWIPSSPGAFGKLEGRKYSIFEYAADGVEILKQSYEIPLPESVSDPFLLNFNVDGHGTSLLGVDRQKLWRHSFSASFFLWNAATGDISPLNEPGVTWQGAWLSPTAQHLAFVKDNSLYLMTLATRDSLLIQAGDPTHDTAFAGIPDWVYEEEVVASQPVLQWSPSGAMLAFMSFNDTEVADYYIEYVKEGEAYPKRREIRYPKPGFPNPSAQLRLLHLSSLQLQTIAAHSSTSGYFSKLTWGLTSGGLEQLAYQSLTRDQRQWTLSLFSASASASAVEEGEKMKGARRDNVIVMHAAPHGWISDGTGGDFVHPSSQWYYVLRQGLRVKEVVLCRMVGSFDCHVVSSPTMNVAEIVGFDCHRRLIVVAAHVGASAHRQLCLSKGPVAGDDKDFMPPSPSPSLSLSFHCLRVGEEEGGVVSGARLSAEGRALTFSWGSASVVARDFLLRLREDAPFSGWSRPLPLLHDQNALLRQQVVGWDLPVPQSLTAAVGMPSWIRCPPAKDHDRVNVQLPVVVVVYGGPDSNAVFDRMEFGLTAFLLSQGSCVARLDGRGTGMQTTEILHAVRGELGHWESVDVRRFALHLAAMPGVDAQRIAVWGWSYGGFLSMRAFLESRRDAVESGFQFAATVSVAPVVDWRIYDSAYTERYMNTPQVNAAGYEHSSNVPLAEYADASLMIMHGVADDNVHWQHTQVFLEACIEHNRNPSLFVYPNKDHGIAAGDHAYHQIYNHLARYLRLPILPWNPT